MTHAKWQCMRALSKPSMKSKSRRGRCAHTGTTQQQLSFSSLLTTFLHRCDTSTPNAYSVHLRECEAACVHLRKRKACEPHALPSAPA